MHRQPTIKEIQRVTGIHLGVSIPKILAPGRNKSNVHACHVAMAICKRSTNFSTKVIGREFGGKVHGTVVRAYLKIEKQALEDQNLNDVLGKIENEVMRPPVSVETLTVTAIREPIKQPPKLQDAIARVAAASQQYENDQFSSVQRISLDHLVAAAKELREAHKFHSKFKT